MDQTMTPQLLCAAARHAPQSPPTSACDELDGNPTHHVNRSHTMAPSSAQTRISDVTIFGSTNPEAMVLATAVPHSAPMRLVAAAITTAWRGVSTFVETTVAMELAVSWKPLMYSNTSATRRTVRMRVIVVCPSPPSTPLSSGKAGEEGGLEGGEGETSWAAQEFFKTTSMTTFPTSRQRSTTFSISS